MSVVAVPADGLRVGEAATDTAGPPAPTRVVHADAWVVATLDRHGRPTPPRHRDDPPLVLRRTGPSTLHLVAVGGGPVAGDELRLRVRVDTGAQLTIRQLAASVALPGAAMGRHGPSRLVLELDVGAGARLTWLGEPLVAAQGCDHETHVRVRLATDASLLLREEVVAGRHGEVSGTARSVVTVVRSDTVLLRTDSVVGGPLWASPAVGGGARVQGTVLVAGPDAPHVPDLGACDRSAATCYLDDGLTLVSVLGASCPEVRARLDAALPASSPETAPPASSDD